MREIFPRPGRGEVRIPALVHLAGATYLFFDARPQPIAGGDGATFTGTALASDLPNPNRIHFSRRLANGTWTEPQPIGGPPISSDAATAATPDGLFVAYASTERVGYFESSFAGERLMPWIATGPTPDQLHHRPVPELYDLTRADGIFATSGSTISLGSRVLVPYVTRRADRTAIYVVHFEGDEIAAISEPIVGPAGAALDETTLALTPAGVVTNSRAQGFAGKGSGVRYLAHSSDGVRFSEPEPWCLPDPGCNAKQLGALFVHPHATEARREGAVVAVPENLSDGARVLSRFGDGGFGYSDAVLVADGEAGDNRLLVVFERDGALWEAELLLADLGRTS